MRCVWDPDKDRGNLRKHGIAFAISCQVFSDPCALTLFDPEHSEDEDRWITIGRTFDEVLIVVVHTYGETEHGEALRVISARKATRLEEHQYLLRKDGQ
jgi:uncharacterized DUF497 family protein